MTLFLSNTSTTAEDQQQTGTLSKFTVTSAAIMPTAEARLGDLVLASSSTWEEVEGNIYVRSPLN